MVRSLAKIVLVVTILLVAVPSTQAAETRTEARSLMSWSFLADLWEIFSTAWGDNGCWVDPNGGCRDSAWGNNGCLVDPSGGCRDSAWGNNGCILDPDGSCRDSAQRENGCLVDPDGGCRD